MARAKLQPAIEPIPAGRACQARLNALAFREPLISVATKLLRAFGEPLPAQGRVTRRRAETEAVALSLRFVCLPSKLAADDYGARLKRLKAQISQALGVSASNVVLHRDPANGSTYWFVAPQDCGIGTPVESIDVKSAAREIEVLLQASLLRASATSNHAAGFVWTDGTTSPRIASAVGPKGRSCQPYILMASGFNQSRTRRYLKCLSVRIEVDRHECLHIDVNRKEFSVPTDGDAVTTSVLASGDGAASIALIDKTQSYAHDARSGLIHSAIPAISFSRRGVRRSCWYALSQLQGFVMATLRSAGVEFDEQKFEATHRIRDGHITPRDFTFPPCVKVINNLGRRLSELEKRLLKKEIEKFAASTSPLEAPAKDAGRSARPTCEVLFIEASDLKRSRCIERDGTLESSSAYLFLNQGVWVKDDESSSGISDEHDEDEDESMDSFDDEQSQDAEVERGIFGSCLLNGNPIDPEKAVVLLDGHDARIDEFDLYTQIKYRTLSLQQAFKCAFQGINIEGRLAEKLDNKYPELRKALGDLVMKWALVQGHFRCPMPLPSGVKLRATFSRASRPSRLNKDDMFQVISRVEIERSPSSKGEVIVRVGRTPGTDDLMRMQWLAESPLLWKRPVQANNTGIVAGRRRGQQNEPHRLRNATFILEDLNEACKAADRTCLVVYDGSTVTIPKIIGDSNKPLLHILLDDLEESLPKDQKALPRSKDENLLPYYIMGEIEQRGHSSLIFLEARNKQFIRYFVPSAVPVQRKMRFAHFYDLMLYRATDQERSNPLPISLDHPLVKSYFAMLTQDVVRLGENSAHTLLRKLCSLVILN